MALSDWCIAPKKATDEQLFAFDNACDENRQVMVKYGYKVMMEARPSLSENDIEELAKIVCRSGKFETGKGTCALVCMDQLGDVRKSGCSHATRLHGKLCRTIIEALGNSEGR